MSSSWFFFFQREGKESRWELERSTERSRVIAQIKPAFSTILDLSSVPEDNDWSKVRYRGPLYFDFDADDDLELACEQFKVFLGKLDLDLGFDISQASFFASGSKGFHIEIPQECFIPKPPPAGTPWLPYVYRAMAESLMVDTLDLNVYTGKRGRQWRTVNVERENGCYKVPLALDEALAITPEYYRELIVEPRPMPAVTPPACSPQFAMLFERSRDKVTQSMRTRKKRQERSSALLAPWKAAKRTPPTIERLMAGEGIAEGAGFQSIAMQISIYATSVEMSLAELLDRTKGLCENHVSDSRRYNTPGKRREELQRMWEYMGENALYDFEVGPIVKLVAPGSDVSDLGVLEQHDKEDAPTTTASSDSDTDNAIKIDFHAAVRRGVFMNGDGIFKRNGDQVDSICRATLRKVESLHDLEKDDFKGYEFDLVVAGRRTRRAMLGFDAFTSAMKMRQFMTAHQISYQGGEPETAALLDIMAEKASRGGKVYVYPREGFFVINHPEKEDPTPIKVYLTQDTYLSTLQPDDEDYFELRYRPTNAVSSYCIDIHKAPDLNESHADAINDLLSFTAPHIVADVVGWMIAAHYRSLYLRQFKQFPMLQVWGEAGSGKTQTIALLARMHWYFPERISIKSAKSSTAFALDHEASSSHSAPLIIDEFKPREMQASAREKYNKLKDVFKASYVGADIGNRGTLNKGAENHLGVIKSKATAPIVFLGEAIESETAIFERCVVVPLRKDLITAERARHWDRLQADATALSSLGKAVLQLGFKIDLKLMAEEMRSIIAQIEAEMPEFEDEHRKRAAPRLIYNRAVIVHALTVLRRVLNLHFGSRFDEKMDEILGSRAESLSGSEGIIAQVQGMSEIAKTVSRIALLSRARDEPWEMRHGKDYIVGDGWVELKLERAYDCYRRYCSSINDMPLFDSLDAFVFALSTYSATIDRLCQQSELREDDSTERIFRLSRTKLMKDHVQSFRDS